MVRLGGRGLRRQLRRCVERLRPGCSYDGVFGQRFASSGTPLGPEFRINSYTTDHQYEPSVAADSAGNFIVVWSGSGLDDTPGVSGQRYASDGTPLGADFRINTYTTNVQGEPDVAAAPSGDFVVLWTGQGQGDDSYGVFGQRFSSSGVPLGPEFRANTFTTLAQIHPSVATDSVGDFVVAWENALQLQLFGQRFASDGTPAGPEFRVNTYPGGFQQGAAVAADAAGNFVVTWDTYGQDGSGRAVFGQRYGRIVPVELLHFRVE